MVDPPLLTILPRPNFAGRNHQGGSGRGSSSRASRAASFRAAGGGPGAPGGVCYGWGVWGDGLWAFLLGMCQQIVTINHPHTVPLLITIPQARDG